jgi:uncharacterized membrane protein
MKVSGARRYPILFTVSLCWAILPAAYHGSAEGADTVIFWRIDGT